MLSILLVDEDPKFQAAAFKLIKGHKDVFVTAVGTREKAIGSLKHGHFDAVVSGYPKGEGDAALIKAMGKDTQYFTYTGRQGHGRLKELREIIGYLERRKMIEHNCLAIVNKNVDAMVVIDLEGVIKFVNPAAASLFDLPETELIGMALGFPIVLIEPVNMYVVRKFKEFVAVEMRMIEVDWEGEPSYLISFRDVTERSRYEEELREAREALETRVRERTAELAGAYEALKRRTLNLNRAEEIADLGYWDWDMVSGEINWSDGHFRIFDYQKQDRVPSYEAFRARVHPEDIARVEMILNEAFSQGIPFNCDYRIVWQDGTIRYIHAESENPSPGRQGRPEKLFGIVQDITDRVMAQKERIKLLQRLTDEHIRLVEAKEQADLYLDLMSHDINNMNQVGIGNIEMALENVDKGEVLKEMLDQALAMLLGSSRLIDNVRKLQRLREGDTRTKPLDLCALVKEISGAYLRRDGRDVDIRADVPESCIVLADELLKDVLSNLIDNALKHSNPLVPVKIGILVTSAKNVGKKTYICSVEDNGPGIPDAMKAKIFTRFQRGNTEAHGKGLGLYLVKALVEKYGGRVWAEDRVPGDHTQGARFVVELPAAD